MRLVTYNVRYFGHGLKGLASTARSKIRIAGAIAALEQHPDVICFQEVEHRSLRSSLAHRGRKKGETQLEAFMRHLEAAFGARGMKCPYQPLYFPANRYQVGRLAVSTSGLSILLHESTTRVERTNADGPQLITHFGKRTLKAKQKRICAHVELECDLGRVHVFNTHLSLPTPFARNYWAFPGKMGHGQNQMHEAQALAKFIGDTAGKAPFILCGDFNASPNSPVYDYLTSIARFRGAQESMGMLDESNAKAFPTAGFLKMRMHLDHVFFRGVELLDMDGTRKFGDPKSPFAGFSDHMPLFANFASGR